MQQLITQNKGEIDMKNFEEKLDRLEQISEKIKEQEVSLDDALSLFEEGIKLAKGMEKEIDKIEGKIQILMNQPLVENDETPELDLFTGANDETGTTGAPKEGTRQ